MPLDPQIQPLVDAVNAAAADAPAIWEQTVEDRREGYRGLSAIAGPGPELDQVTDSTAAGVPIRIYANEGATGVFLYIHGGGYTIGDIETHDQPCRQLALESGAIVISPDYRLAPEHPFPAGVDDSWAVLQWIVEEYGADHKIVVGGDSAGGNLSAVLAIMARDADIKLCAQLLIYPAVDAEDDSPSMTENGTGYILSKDTMDWFSQQYAADAADFRASPIRAESLAGVAPAVVITAEFDPLRDQGAAYAEALTAAGVDTTYTNYDGMVHAFFQLGPIIEAAATAVTQIATAAKSALAADEQSD